MGFGVQFGYAVQHLIDTQLNWTRAAHPVYLRLRNFVDFETSLAGGMGFAISPSGADTFNSGTTDILISPPPAITPISVHNIGQSVGKLRFGAKMFLISATFVEKQVSEQSLANQDLVWRGQNVVGLVNDSQLFSIEDVKKKEAAGRTVAWVLTCNSAEPMVATT